MKPKRPRHVRVLLLMLCILIGFVVIDAVFRPSIEAMRWVLGCVVAYLIADACTKRDEQD
ncbi:hypothetical protein EII34_07730 [Arachnia propionica]|uniref:Uncharacterized protein n=1 Tax=Arachnia propionica TaxID=1750 RepID=A0A3P1T9S0_9ACTN|nr:hypothetical protein [Arachnia propionica]MDO5083991.1 hypothetical protein [Arachnia propionica]RRD05213.1 hypothetical protein EII34_07730 [Arachnia propionica]